MAFYYVKYWHILVFIVVSVLIVLILFMVAYLLSPKSANKEKSSAYECGFEPFDESRKTFDIQFFIVGILFLIFDLEVAFIFPWAVSLSSIGIFGFWVMMLFFIIINIGFVYEWQRGALDWSFNYKE